MTIRKCQLAALSQKMPSESNFLSKVGAGSSINSQYDFPGKLCCAWKMTTAKIIDKKDKRLIKYSYSS